MGAIILAKKQEAEETGYVKLEDAPYYDMVWTTENLLKFPKTALLAGLAAGLLGIGGGMVLGPLFIEIGMQPTVAKSSCAFMILWTGLSGVIQYAMADSWAGSWRSTLCAWATAVGRSDSVA